jgi:hypothetical protein
MTIVDFDRILAQSPQGYTARAQTDVMGSTNAVVMPLSLEPQFLGGLSLQAALRWDTSPANVPARVTDFVTALRKLQVGAPDRDTIEEVGPLLYAALPGAVQDLFNGVWGAIRLSTVGNGVAPNQDRLLRLRRFIRNFRD